jgi:Fe-S cluster assembly scaffold protein SufB
MSWFVPPIVVAGRAVGSRTAWPRRSSTARLVREHRRGVLGFDVRHGMRTKYSTAQNWYPGDAEGHGGILNFVTKRGDCRGARSKISWTLEPPENTAELSVAKKL